MGKIKIINKNIFNEYIPKDFDLLLEYWAYNTIEVAVRCSCGEIFIAENKYKIFCPKCEKIFQQNQRISNLSRFNKIEEHNTENGLKIIEKGISLNVNSKNNIVAEEVSNHIITIKDGDIIYNRHPSREQEDVVREIIEKKWNRYEEFKECIPLLGDRLFDNLIFIMDNVKKFPKLSQREFIINNPYLYKWFIYKYDKDINPNEISKKIKVDEKLFRFIDNIQDDFSYFGNIPEYQEMFFQILNHEIISYYEVMRIVNKICNFKNKGVDFIDYTSAKRDVISIKLDSEGLKALEMFVTNNIFKYKQRTVDMFEECVEKLYYFWDEKIDWSKLPLKHKDINLFLNRIRIKEMHRFSDDNIDYLFNEFHNNPFEVMKNFTSKKKLPQTKKSC